MGAAGLLCALCAKAAPFAFMLAQSEAMPPCYRMTGSTVADWAWQMADHVEVLTACVANEGNGISYPVLTPNLMGFKAAVRLLAYTVSAGLVPLS